MVKNPPTMQETWVSSLDGEVSLEEGMATHSSILAWRIPWTEKPGGLTLHGVSKTQIQLREIHTHAHAHTHTHTHTHAGARARTHTHTHTHGARNDRDNVVTFTILTTRGQQEAMLLKPLTASVAITSIYSHIYGNLGEYVSTFYSNILIFLPEINGIPQE